MLFCIAASFGMPAAAAGADFRLWMSCSEARMSASLCTSTSTDLPGGIC